MSPDITIRIPGPLRGYTDGLDAVHVDAATVGEALTVLGEHHPGVLERVVGRDGGLGMFVSVYVGDRDIRGLQGLETPVRAGDVLALIPAVAGG